MRLGILGGGRAAWAYGTAWRSAGWPVTGVWLRHESASRLPELLGAPRSSIDDLARASDLLLIAVSDRAINEVAQRIPDTTAVIFHASGAMRSIRGGFSLHPLAALAPVGEPSDLSRRLLVFEGARSDLGRAIAEKIGARIATIDPGQKARYHAGAVFGSNYVAAMLDIADSLIAHGGAREDIGGLARSAIDNWVAHTDAKRFTGPAARGDDEVLALHRDALSSEESLREIYTLIAAEIRRRILAREE